VTSASNGEGIGVSAWKVLRVREIREAGKLPPAPRSDFSSEIVMAAQSAAIAQMIRIGRRSLPTRII